MRRDVAFCLEPALRSDQARLEGRFEKTDPILREGWNERREAIRLLTKRTRLSTCGPAEPEKVREIPRIEKTNPISEMGGIGVALARQGTDLSQWRALRMKMGGPVLARDWTHFGRGADVGQYSVEKDQSAGALRRDGLHQKHFRGKDLGWPSDR